MLTESRSYGRSTIRPGGRACLSMRTMKDEHSCLIATTVGYVHSMLHRAVACSGFAEETDLFVFSRNPVSVYHEFRGLTEMEKCLMPTLLPQANTDNMKTWLRILCLFTAFGVGPGFLSPEVQGMQSLPNSVTCDSIKAFQQVFPWVNDSIGRTDSHCAYLCKMRGRKYRHVYPALLSACRTIAIWL